MDHGAVLPAEMTERPVLVVRAPNLPEEGRASLRDYVVDSLRLGVLIIWPGVSYSLERFPQLGGVLCCGTEPAGSPPGQEPAATGQEEVLLREHPVPQPVIKGYGAAEKKAILNRLKKYREAHGLGCLDGLAKVCGGSVTADLLREVLSGSPSMEMSTWRCIGRGLDKMEGGGNGKGD